MFLPYFMVLAASPGLLHLSLLLLSCPMIWALGLTLGIFTAAFTEAEGKEVEQDQRGPLFSWL